MVNTILNDDERRALMVLYGSSATPDENNDYMTGDYPLVCATEAAVLAKLREQEPVAWIRPSGKAMLKEGGHCTVYASDGMSNHSVPLYAAPLPAVVQVPQGWKLVPVEALTRWRDAFAEELAAYDIDPPIHHVLTSHDEIAAMLAAAPEAPAQPSVPAPWREVVKVMREALAAYQEAVELSKHDFALFFQHANKGEMKLAGVSVMDAEMRLTAAIMKARAALAQLDSLEGGE